MDLDELIEKLSLAQKDETAMKELEKFGVTTDKIEGLKDLKAPATLDEALENKEIQSEFDRRLAKAATTREERLKEKFDFKEKEQPKKEDPKGGDNQSDNPAMKAMMEQIQKMAERIESFEKEKQQMTIEQKKAKVLETLRSKNIPEVYVHEFDLEKDVDEQLDTVSKKFEEQFGQFQPKSPGAGRPPVPTVNGGNGKPSKDDIEKFKSNF